MSSGRPSVAEVTRAAWLVLALGCTTICLGLTSLTAPPSRDASSELATADSGTVPGTASAGADDAAPAQPDAPGGFGGLPATPFALCHLAAAATFGLPSTGPSAPTQAVTDGQVTTEPASCPPASTGDCWFATRGFLDATTTALRDRL